MNCQEVVERMHRYLDRDLTPEETAEMFQHVAVCKECAETFQILKALNRELEDLPAVSPPVSLVDAIMPKLVAIDLERGSLMDEQAAKNEKSSEMTPELGRTKRAGSWWGTIAGRTAIGAAAAAVILGVAIFNYQPKMLSDAELPYNEEASTTSAGLPDAAPEAEHPSEEPRIMNKDAGSGSAEGYAPMNEATPSEDEPSKETGSDETAKDQSDPPNAAGEGNGQPKDSGDPNASESNPAAGTRAPVESNDKTSTHSANANSYNPGSAEPPSDQSEPANGGSSDAVSPPQEPATPNADTPPPAQDPAADEGGSAAALESTEPADQMMGIMRAPEQWTSPNARYMASSEGDQLVIYRVPAANSEAEQQQSMEEIGRLPLGGSLVSGQWSPDSLTFKYKVKVNAELIESVYTVEETAPPQSGQPSSKEPPAKP
ncbi:zf-HC2 domain-containing protein [Paenibacillus lactis]|uniref:zf-HC2 domain-containing protein n=1 Tax=Paenibacillus lactis TaxID=228574 RepID=UPI001B0011F8|nr:zf-HC2 domain-containing protein [Paenibacillus lactis]GIO90588.1 hypothetical protein J31TS3_18150 [Paenibacillus lactis]